MKSTLPPEQWLFPVGEAPVRVAVTHDGCVRDVTVPHKRALIAGDTGEVLAIVSAGYLRELGDNAYAVFNAMTDIAARPPASRRFRRDRPTLERRAGMWLRDITAAASEPGFSMARHMAGVATDPAASNRPTARPWPAIRGAA